MKSPSYYVSELQLDVEPNLDDVDLGGSSLDFEVDDIPEYDSDLQALHFDASIELILNRYRPSMQEGTQEDGKIGSVDIEVTVVVEGDKDEFQEHMSIWSEEGYREVEWDFRYHVESGIITDVFSPVSGIINNSFRGILPGLSFTSPPDAEPEELPVKKTEFLRQYLAENIKAEIVDYANKNTDIEFDHADIEVAVTESLDEVECTLPDVLEGKVVRDDVTDIISDTFDRIVQEEADEDIQISAVDVSNPDSSDSVQDTD